MGAQLFDEAFIKVLVEYSDYSNIILVKNTPKLSKNTRINEYTINLEENKQPLFGLIFSLRPVKLETLKTYIKTNLANGFIWPSKSPAKAPIFFDRKLDRSFCLYRDY